MTAIRLRPLSDVDGPALLELLDRCSAPTLYERFFTGTPDAARRHVRTLLTDPDGYTVVAERFGMAGFGSLFFDGPDEAEIALLVADGYQGRGIGTALAEHLCRYAAGRGTARLRLTALAGNHRSPYCSAGARRPSSSTRRTRVRSPRPSGSRPARPARRLRPARRSRRSRPEPSPDEPA
jgi:GNAT superfamily N-acetyltransferase